jgi:integrase
MAKLYKDPNSPYWFYDFKLPDQKRVRRSTRTTDKLKAQEYADKRQAEAWDKTHLGIQREIFWYEAVVRWVKWAQKHIKPKTLSDRNTQFKWLDPHIGNLPLSAITEELIDDLIDIKLAEGVKYRTVNIYIAAISTVLHKCLKPWGYISKLPQFNLLPEDKKRVRFLSKADAAKLLLQLPPHLEVMVRFSLATGLRKSNVTNLTWSQIDLENNLAWIHADQTKSKKGKGKTIRVPLNKTGREVLYAQKGKHPTHIFHYNGEPIKNPYTRAFKNALKRAEITEFTWHDLRHTWASWHIQNGTPIEGLKQLGAWSSLDMVERYAHLAPQHLANYASNIE